MNKTEIISWIIKDDGRLSGEVNMANDQAALDHLNSHQSLEPTLHFFQWTEPTISYGYLMDEKRVRTWNAAQSGITIVRRPTGGGVVLHTTEELSVSLLWPRGHEIFPERPRDCYEAIHHLFIRAVKDSGFDFSGTLFVKPQGSCAQPTARQERFSLCFQEPVCNDVMVGDIKVIGGALRITKKAILYQGTIQLGGLDFTTFKKSLTKFLSPG